MIFLLYAAFDFEKLINEVSLGYNRKTVLTKFPYFGFSKMPNFKHERVLEPFLNDPTSSCR